MEIENVESLIQGAKDLDDMQRLLLHSRVFPLLTNTFRNAKSAEKWDGGLFLGGFCASLVVTIATAINLAGYISDTASSAVSTGILVLSSLATAILGLRERLRLRENALLGRRSASLMQKALILFLASAPPYAAGPTASFHTFVTDIEVIKSLTEQAQSRLQDYGSSSTTTGPVPPESSAAAATVTATASASAGAGTLDTIPLDTVELGGANARAPRVHEPGGLSPPSRKK